MKGQDLSSTFSFLRPNDLVWNYVVGNYLKGEKPPAFDLLYWNGDSTNLPGPMYCWYLRHTYLQNDLKKPGALTVCGEKMDAADGVVQVRVTAAKPMPAEATARLAAVTGGQAHIDVTVDAALIGGVAIRVGDTLVDASVRRQLREMRQAMLNTPIASTLWAS